MPAYEYARVPWDEVAGHAAQGWRLMPIPPMPEMKAVLGQVQMTGVILYHLERERAAAQQDRVAEHDRGAQHDRAGDAGRSLWSPSAGESR